MVEIVSMKPVRTMRAASSGTAVPTLTKCASELVKPVIHVLLYCRVRATAGGHPPGTCP